MPAISQSKKDKISEQILHYLFTISPESEFTSDISREIIRDEEFTKLLLVELEKKKLIISIDKNPQGIKYSRRQRWRLSQQVYDAYKKQQSSLNSNNNKVTPQNSDNFNDFGEELV
jgi:predicted transcriptional regulator with HTH domain